MSLVEEKMVIKMKVDRDWNKKARIPCCDQFSVDCTRLTHKFQKHVLGTISFRITFAT